MDIKDTALPTRRLILQKTTAESIEALFQTATDAEIMQVLHLESREKLEEQRQKYQGGLRTYNREFVWFHIVHRETNVFMGSIGYHIWYTDHHRAEIGYALIDDVFKNKGYMTEAVEAVLAFGFNCMHLQRVEAMVGIDNVPSLKLMERFGFQKEGHLRAHYLRNGVYEDSLVFSLLASEYQVD